MFMLLSAEKLRNSYYYQIIQKKFFNLFFLAFFCVCMLLIRFIIQIRLSQYTTNSLLAFQLELLYYRVLVFLKNSTMFTNIANIWFVIRYICFFFFKYPTFISKPLLGNSMGYRHKWLCSWCMFAAMKLYSR